MLRQLACWLLLVLLCVPALHAQSQATTGVIEGVVLDESGAALPGVTVSLKNTATNFEKVAVTDANGRFRGLLLPLGPYTVTSSLEGFATLVREGIDLALGQSVSLTFSMTLSTIQEEIRVTGEAPLIESTRTEGQVRIDDAMVEGLPNNGRNFLDFTKLTPGVAIVQGPDGEELSINGQKGISNNVAVDGADFNNPFFGEQRGGQRPPFTFNIDAVKEVLVVTDGAPAEFGRSSGGFINVVTKSGTNDYRWTAHAFFKNDSLSEDRVNRDGSTEESDFDQAQYGFTVGGPMKKDKAFFFVAYDVQAGDETKQTDPNRIDPRLVELFADLGAPNENAAINRTDDADVALAKFDIQANEKNLVTLRGTYTFSEQVNGTFDADTFGVSANAVEQDYSTSFTAAVISTVSDTLLNEFRGQFAVEDRPRPYKGPLAPDGTPFPDTGILEGDYRFGMPFFIPVEYDDDRLQFNNNVSFLKGNHSIKAGIEYNEVGSSQTFIGFANGRYIFTTIDGFLNYADNPDFLECSDGSTSQTGACPPGAIAVGPVDLFLQFAGVGQSAAEAGTQTLDQTETALFIQDQWQPTANLTLEYGVRWEQTKQPDPITPPSEVFYADFIGQPGFPGDGTIPDDDSFQPRLAVAWTPKGKGNTVVRATGGIFTARTPALSLASQRTTNGSVGQTLFRNSFLSPAGIGVFPPTPAWPGLLPAAQIGAVFFPDVYVADTDYELPKTQAYSLSWEREIVPNYALLVKLNYAKTDHITGWTNRNDPLLGSPWSSGLAPDGINGINTLWTMESRARSRYYGVTLGINKRYSNNLQFQAYYTNSLDRSDDDNERDPFTLRYAKITNLEAEYAESDRHQRNRFNGWILWNAPGGIDVNTRLTFLDAQPQDIRPDGQPVTSFPVVERCIPEPPAGSGCAPDAQVFRRNQGEKDNEFFTIDLRLAKDFKVGKYTIQPVIDIFNLTDEENFLVPEKTNLAANFDGTLQSGAGEPREIQIGIRILN